MTRRQAVVPPGWEVRAATGVNARGRYEGFTPENATRWQSDAACVVARDRLWALPEAQHQ